jgi:hypothetical protein
MDLLKPVIKKLGSNAELFIIEGGDHSFHVSKEFKLSDGDVITLLCKEVKRWLEENG